MALVVLAVELAVGCARHSPRPSLGRAVHARWYLVPAKNPSGLEDRLYLTIMNTGEEPVSTKVHVDGRGLCCAVDELAPGRITIFDLGAFACALPTRIDDCCALPTRGGECAGVVNVRYATPTLSALPGTVAPPCTKKEESNSAFSTADPKCFACDTKTCAPDTARAGGRGAPNTK